MHLSIPVLMDKDNSMTDAFKVTALPWNFIIQHGRIVRRDLRLDSDSLIETVEALMAELPP
jgi:hypothetical protein